MESKKRTYLSLLLDYGRLYLINDDLKKQKEELESFLDGINYMNSIDFSRKVLFGQEIKSNNTIEGYLDDIVQVKSVIKHPITDLSDEQKRRILNMYYGYKYILKEENIDKENLKKLYGILSDKLLSDFDLSNMGSYYRKNDVFIFYSNNVNKEPDKGVDASLLEEKVNILLEYLNDDKHFNCMTDYFIKSQIAHFYFVYLHPYYDINGRTARTTSMWYLLKNKAYPYIIFNRAIQLDKSKYYKVIRDGKIYHNVTYFLNYMLKNVLLELEKEYTMELISDKSRYELTDAELQTLYYILSMNGILTCYDFAAFYNHLNNHKSPRDIYSNILEPLVDKGVIVLGKSTQNGDNRFFGLNKDCTTSDPKIKYLNLQSKIL